jgi:hypothetical protein
MQADIDTIDIGGEWITPLSNSRIEINPELLSHFPTAPHRTELSKARDDTPALHAGVSSRRKGRR